MDPDSWEPRSVGPRAENFEKLDALRGAFPPSQKLKDIPTKCILGKFCRKPYVVIKKQFSRATKYLGFPKKCVKKLGGGGFLTSLFIKGRLSKHKWPN
jgi:hypothetical protein